MNVHELGSRSMISKTTLHIGIRGLLTLRGGVMVVIQQNKLSLFYKPEEEGHN